MNDMLWFHFGTQARAAIYPDDIDGTTPLRSIESCIGLSPVRWVHRESQTKKAIYPQSCDGITGVTAYANLNAPNEYPVFWFARNTQQVTISVFPDALTAEEAPAYTGPLDLVSGAVVAFDQFAPSAAWLAGTNLYVTLERSSDNATQSFNYAADGSVNQVAIIAWRDALGAATAIVREWGNACDANNSAIAPTVGAGTPAVPPTWLTNQVGGICSFGFNGTTQFLGTESAITLPDGAYTIFAVVKSDAVSVNDKPICGMDAFNFEQPLYAKSSWIDGACAQATLAASSDGFGTNGLEKTYNNPTGFDSSAYKILTIAFSFTESIFRINGAVATLSSDSDIAAVGSISKKLGIGCDDGVEINALWLGKIAALYIYNGIKSGADISELESKFASNFTITLAP